MPESRVNQDKGVQSVQAPKADFLGIQGTPLDHAPDGLEFEQPERYDGEEDQAGKKRQAEEVGPDARRIDEAGGKWEAVCRYSWSRHLAVRWMERRIVLW